MESNKEHYQKFQINVVRTLPKRFMNGIGLLQSELPIFNYAEVHRLKTSTYTVLSSSKPLFSFLICVARALCCFYDRVSMPFV